MDTVVTTYIVYLVITIALTVWVGRTLYRNGAIFLVDVFGGNKDLASAVNHLLVVGFYLINLGYVTLMLRISNPPDSAQTSVEALSVKVGSVLIVLGLMHLANIYIFNRLRTRARDDRRPPRPPVAADWRLSGVAPQPPA